MRTESTHRLRARAGQIAIASRLTGFRGYLQQAHAVRKDVGEAQQQRRVQAAPLQRLHHLQHIDGIAACIVCQAIQH